MSLLACNSGNTLCLYKTTSPDNTTLITIDAKVPESNGWAAFGLGKQMADSTMFIFWKNATGGCVVSSRSASEKEMPGFSTNQLAQLAPLDSAFKSKDVASSNLKCTISRTDESRVNLGKDFIWGIGAGVQRPNDPKSSFQKHTDKGLLVAKDSKSNSYSISAISAGSLILSAMFVL